MLGGKMDYEKERWSTTKSLIFSCMADTLFPQMGIAKVEILEHLNLDAIFPKIQTCCDRRDKTVTIRPKPSK